MESKKFLFYVALLFLAFSLGAQEYYVDQTGGETRIVQRLAWQADKNAWRYEIVIEELIRDDEPSESGELLGSGEPLEGDELLGIGEQPEGDETSGGDELPGVSVADAAASIVAKAATEAALTGNEEAFEESGTFTRVLREFTEKAYIEVSLPPGIYRYQVTAYDFLDRPGVASKWARLRILKALEPELHDFSPRVFYVDGDGPWVLNLTGRNISPDAEASLKYSEKNWAIVPREYTGDDSLSGAQLVFDIRQLVPGNYEIYIENPGGLNASAGTFEIGFYKSYDMYVGAAYTPLISIYGELGKLEKKPFFPLGAAVRFAVLPFKKSYGHFGLELGAVWNYLASGTGENKVSYHVAGAELNILYQKWLPNRVMAFTIRAGGGVAGTTDMLLPRVEVGASFLWLIHKPFFVEAGLDGVHWFAGDRYSPGYLRPWLGGGIKL